MRFIFVYEFITCFLILCTQRIGVITGKQEYSSRTLGATWGIISAIMVPIVIVLICIGWRILLRRKREEKEENDFNTIRTRTIDPDESMKINSDDDSIPYKKDIEDSPEPTDPVRVIDNENQAYEQGYPYGDPEIPIPPPQPQPLPQPYGQPQQSGQVRTWSGETEIN